MNPQGSIACEACIALRCRCMEHWSLQQASRTCMLWSGRRGACCTCTTHSQHHLHHHLHPLPAASCHLPPAATSRKHHLPPAASCHHRLLPPPATSCHLLPAASTCHQVPPAASTCRPARHGMLTTAAAAAGAGACPTCTSCWCSLRMTSPELRRPDLRRDP